MVSVSKFATDAFVYDLLDSMNILCNDYSCEAEVEGLKLEIIFVGLFEVCRNVKFNKHALTFFFLLSLSKT